MNKKKVVESQKAIGKAEGLDILLDWLTDIIHARLKIYFQQADAPPSVSAVVTPIFEDPNDSFSVLNQRYRFNREELVALALALSAVLKPRLLDAFYLKNAETGERFTEFGCIRGTQHNGLLPTFETLIFLLGGDDMRSRLRVLRQFGTDNRLFRQQLLTLDHRVSHEPFGAALLLASPDLIEQVVYQREYAPEFSTNFPAKCLSVRHEWSDLILPDETLVQINEIKTWIEYGDMLLQDWGMHRKIMPGYRALFYGASGTGKTLTAGLLGKYTGREVYKIDLSMVVSKFIGETEKNLSTIFERAENKNWILFFDEADALFGKRTEVRDAHDRYANQEVSFLLQRVEDFNGVVILASNFKSNIDAAFVRRFQSIIQFSMPRPVQRRQIWANTFSQKTPLADDVDLDFIAKQYEMSGGSIVNVVRYASLMAAQRREKVICNHDVIQGIRKEFLKEGKMV